MLRLPWQRRTRVGCLCLWLGAVGCASAERGPEPVQGPNPAARKCLDDGYDLEPVHGTDGLPIDHDCVDKRTGTRCDAWDYFRGSCQLRARASDVPN